MPFSVTPKGVMGKNFSPTAPMGLLSNTRKGQHFQSMTLFAIRLDEMPPWSHSTGCEEAAAVCCNRYHAPVEITASQRDTFLAHCQSREIGIHQLDLKETTDGPSVD
jgi:hypothetical protein